MPRWYRWSPANGLKDVANAIKSAGEPLHIEPDLDLMVKSFAQRGVTVE